MGAKVLSFADALQRRPCRRVGDSVPRSTWPRPLGRGDETPLGKALAAVAACDPAADFARKVETFRQTFTTEIDKQRRPPKQVSLAKLPTR